MPSRKHDLIPVEWSEGSGKNLAKNKNFADHWSRLRAKFVKPFVTPEKRKAFDKMTKEQMDDLKKIDGWYSGATFDGKWRNKKNLRPRNLMTIDIDYPEHVSICEEIEAGVIGLDKYVGLWHSSRRHTPTAPRVRGLFLLSRKVSTDEYTALVRYAGYKIDPSMKTVDPVSYRPAQMMFKPTCSVDDAKNYFFFLQSEDYHQVIPVDDWLDEITVEFGDWSDLSLLPRHPDEENFRKHAEKAEDPLLKRGPVGDFCRAYPDIEVGMEKFLEGVYLPTEVDGRYTYAGASSSSGAVIYENKFLYSFHGTDPVQEQLVNLFDLVRIHKFGDEDVKEDGDYKRMTDRPSWRAMMDFVKQDPGFRKARAESKYGAIYDAEFDYEEGEEAEPAAEENDDPESDQEGDSAAPGDDDVDDSDDGSGDRDAGSDGGAWSQFDEFEEPRPERKASSSTGKKSASAEEAAKARSWIKPPKDWLTTTLEFTEEGELKGTLSNLKNILQFEKRFWGKIGFNEFTQRVVLIGDINPRFPGMKPIVCTDRVNGTPWEDYMDGVIHYIMEAPRGGDSPGWGCKVSIGDIQIAVEQVARTNSFHPIRERFVASSWDSTYRAERVFIDYLGEPDTPYAREVARMFFTAAVYRIMTPGKKWDNTLMIQGPQGCRKSTFCKALGWETYHGELHARLDDYGRIAEQIGGAWIMELPELAGFTKTDANHLKTFTRKVDDSWRMAYMKHIVQLPRQFVLIGTTNQERVLKDDTGNRTYLMLRCHVVEIDIDKLRANIDQIWAEAYQWYLEARTRQPEGDLNLDYKTPEAKKEAEFRQSVARMETITERLCREVIDWADGELTIRELMSEMKTTEKALEQFPLVDEGEDDPGAQLVRRTVFREKDVREHVFKQDRLAMNPQVDAAIQGVMDWLQKNGWTKTPTKRVRFGTHRAGGIQGIWYEREGALSDDIARGYEIIDDFNPEDYV
jgi:putative DNA primase/helicase